MEEVQLLPTYRIKYGTPEGTEDEISVTAEDEFDAEERAREELSSKHPSVESDDWVFIEVAAERPDEDTASEAIDAFLLSEFGEVPDYELQSDEYAWAFWIRGDDTTSYLKANLKVEWYGTYWRPGDTEVEPRP